MFKKRKYTTSREYLREQLPQEEIDREDYIGARSVPIDLKTHYEMLKEVSRDITELRRELLGFPTVFDLDMYDMKRAKDMAKKTREKQEVDDGYSR